MIQTFSKGSNYRKLDYIYAYLNFTNNHNNLRQDDKNIWFIYSGVNFYLNQFTNFSKFI